MQKKTDEINFKNMMYFNQNFHIKTLQFRGIFELLSHLNLGINFSMVKRNVVIR